MSPRQGTLRTLYGADKYRHAAAKAASLRAVSCFTKAYVPSPESADPSIYSGQQEIDGVAYNPAVTPAGVSDYLDTSNSRAHVMLRRGWAVDDDIDQFRIDGTWNEGETSGLTRARFGAMLSQETKALERWDN